MHNGLWPSREAGTSDARDHSFTTQASSSLKKEQIGPRRIEFYCMIRIDDAAPKYVAMGEERPRRITEERGRVQRRTREPRSIRVFVVDGKTVGEYSAWCRRRSGRLIDH